MAAEEWDNSKCLTTTGEAVVRRLVESNRESSLASTQPLGVPAARRSEIICECFVICAGLFADDWGFPNVPVCRDDASRLILSTLLILQDEQPPPPEQLCLGLGKLHDCGQQITRIRNLSAIDHQTLHVTVKLRQPAESHDIYVVSARAISLFPVIRLNNHPRLCDKHEELMEELLHNVLLSTDFLDNWVIDAYDRLSGLQNQTPRFCRNNSWTSRTFIDPDLDTEVRLPPRFFRNNSWSRTFIDPDLDTEVITAFDDQRPILKIFRN